MVVNIGGEDYNLKKGWELNLIFEDGGRVTLHNIGAGMVNLRCASAQRSRYEGLTPYNSSKSVPLNRVNVNIAQWKGLTMTKKVTEGILCLIFLTAATVLAVILIGIMV